MAKQDKLFFSVGLRVLAVAYSMMLFLPPVAVCELQNNTAGAVPLFENTPWPMYRYDSQHTGATPSTAPQNNNTIWVTPVDNQIVGTPAVVNNTVFVVTTSGRVYALDMNTSDELWVIPLPTAVVSSPAIYGGKLFVGGVENGKLYAIDIATRTISSDSTLGNITASPTIANGNVYFGCIRFEGHPRDGMIKSFTVNNFPYTQSFRWLYRFPGGVTTSPAVANGRVYVAVTEERKIVCFNENGPNPNPPLWEYVAPGALFGSVAVAYGHIYFGCGDKKVYCIPDNNPTTPIWSFLTGGRIYGAPAVGSNRVVIGSEDGKVYCLDAQTGAHRWNYTTGGVIQSSPAISSDGKVFIGSDDGWFYALNLSTGVLIWKYRIGTPLTTASPAVAYGRVYLGAPDCRAYCFGEAAGIPRLFSVATVTPSTVELGGRVTVSVHVTDGSSPVNDARVSLSSDRGGSFDTAAGNTNSAGDFRTGFTAPMTLGVVTIYANISKPGYIKNSTKTMLTVAEAMNARIDASDLTLYSNESTTITVTVSAGGTGVEGVNVLLTSSGGSFAPSTGLTDSSGMFISRFCAPNVTAETRVIITATCSKSGYNTTTANITIIVRPLLPTLRVAVFLSPQQVYKGESSEVTVLVSNQTSGEPVQGANVSMQSDSGGDFSPEQGETDATGRFRTRFSSPSNIFVSITCNITAVVAKSGMATGIGYAHLFVSTEPFLTVKIALRPQFVFSNGSAEVEVQVRAQTDIGGAEIRMEFEGASDGCSISPSQGFTDAKGLFRCNFTAGTVVSDTIYTIVANASKSPYLPGSARATITVRYGTNSRPECNITAPADGERVSGVVRIEGTATDPDGDAQLVRVEVRIDDGNWREAINLTAWHYSWDASRASTGLHRIFARAFDGTDYSQIASISVEVGVGNHKPVCTILQPENGSVVSKNVEILVSVSDEDGLNQVQSVRIRIGTGVWFNATLKEVREDRLLWMFNWDTTTSADGNCVIYAVASDGTEDSNLAVVNVLVKNRKDEFLGDWKVMLGIFLLIIVFVLVAAIVVQRARKRRYYEVAEKPRTIVKRCPWCDEPAGFMANVGRWYCHKCRRYLS